MDLALLGGMIIAVFSIIANVLWDGNSFAVLWGASSMFIVVLGSIGCAVATASLETNKAIGKAFKEGLQPPDFNVDGMVTVIGQLADIARREGVLALESKIATLDDPFLAQGAQMIIDGMDSERVEETLYIRMETAKNRRKEMISWFENWSGFLPSFGMIGTVVGLVNMLQNLSDPSQLGAGMAVALLTTLYGVLLANIIANPYAAKLTSIMDEEQTAMKITLDGVLSIQAGMSPQMLVERLESYLSPDLQIGYADRMAEAAPLVA